MNTRRLTFGLATLFGLRRRGWFIPHRYADQLAAAERQDYPEVRDLMRGREAAFAGLIDTIDCHAAALLAVGGAPPAPRFEQDWFPRLDAAAAYAMVRRHRPRRIVEVGSGHSTRFLARAAADGGLETEITIIDPAPRAILDGLPLRRLHRTLQQAGHQPFQGLAAGDMAVVDSSHILMPGSDVDVFLNRVLPRLPSGVLVHFHDIFLPEPYPSDWAWRAYNEQQAVAPLFLSGAYLVEFASRYVATSMAGRLENTVLGRLPLPDGAFESSLWLSKT